MMSNSRNSGADSLIADLQTLIKNINISKNNANNDNVIGLTESKDFNLKIDNNKYNVLTNKPAANLIESEEINKTTVTHYFDSLRESTKKDNFIQINEILDDNNVLEEWEKHGKGIATKLLEKAGFQPGKGLDKNIQGMVSPIETTPGRGRGALGLYGPKGTNSSEGQILKAMDDSKKKFTQTVDNRIYNISDQGVGLKMKYNQPHKNVKSIYGTEHFMPENSKEVDHPSKQSNIESFPATLNNRQKSSTKRTNQNPLKKSKNSLKHQNSSISHHNSFGELGSQFMKMRLNDSEKSLNVAKRLKDYEEDCMGIPLVEVLEKCSLLLETLQWDSNEKDTNEKITTEIVKIITKAVKEEFIYWDPLKEGKKGLGLMAFTRQVLLSLPHPDQEKNTMHFRFDTILYNIIMPKIRSSIRSWDVRQPEDVMNLFDMWDIILSPDMRSDIVTNHVYFQLERYIKKWDPINDSMPLESWIHPWLKDLENKAQEFYPLILKKLKDALVDSEVDEFNPQMMMKAGLAILDEKHVHIFVVGQVVPKLIKHSRNIQFDLEIQNFTKLKQVTDWSKYVPQKIIVNVLAENFFPKLIQTVASWIAFRKVEMNELCLWLAQWLKQIPRFLKSNAKIKEFIDSIYVLIKLGISMSEQKADK